MSWHRRSRSSLPRKLGSASKMPPSLPRCHPICMHSRQRAAPWRARYSAVAPACGALSTGSWSSGGGQAAHSLESPLPGCMPCWPRGPAPSCRRCAPTRSYRIWSKQASRTSQSAMLPCTIGCTMLPLAAAAASAAAASVPPLGTAASRTVASAAAICVQQPWGCAFDSPSAWYRCHQQQARPQNACCNAPAGSTRATLPISLSGSPPMAPCHWGRGPPCLPAGSGCPGRTPPHPWRLAAPHSGAPSSPVKRQRCESGSGGKGEAASARWVVDLRRPPIVVAAAAGLQACRSAQPSRAGCRAGLMACRWLQC